MVTAPPTNPGSESPSPDQNQGSTARVGALTILVVDDDDSVRSFLDRVLRRRGHRVVHATDGQEALRCCRETRIDLVVTDLCMPGMDGIELVMQLRRNCRTTPVIAISGAMVGYTECLLHTVEVLGAQLTLKKPFPLGQLIEAIDRLLGARTARFGRLKMAIERGRRPA